MGRRLTSPVLVGRATEMAVIEALLAESRSGSRFVAITGEAGIGKTRLLSTLISLAADAGIPTFAGACPIAAGGQPIPFAAITQVLRSIVRSMDARHLDRTLGSARIELARLLPELGDPADDVTSTGPRELGRLFEAVLLLVERAALSKGAVLALEDLHWADPVTWSLVSHLHRNLGSSPVLIAVTYREDDPAVGPEREAIAEIARDPTVERIRLEALTGDDAYAYLRALPDAQLTDGDIAAIVRRAEGIPFYLEELADQSITRSSAVLPVSVRASVEVRTARLPPPSRLIVELVATSDGPMDVRLLRAASGLDEPGLEDALAEALASDLLVRAGSRDELVDTRHTLVREALVEGLVPGQSARLHAAHAHAVETHLEWAGTSDVERTRRLANHLLAAGELVRAVPALLRAGQTARQSLAFQDADEAYQEAFRHLADGPPPFAADAWRQVLEDAAEAARLAGAPDRAVLLQERAVARTDVADVADVDGYAMARIRLARYHAEAGRPGVASMLLREVAASAGAELQGRCALELARVLLATRDYAAAIEQAELARRTARDAGDVREEARASAALGVALSMLGRHDEALRALAASRQGPLRDDDDPAPSRARPSRLPDSFLRHVDRATILALAGDPESASRAALEGAATADRAGVGGPWAAILAAVAGRELMRMGRWDEAWAALREAVEGDRRAGAAARVLRALLAIRRGDLAAGETALGAVALEDLAATPGTGWIGVRAMAAAELAMARSGLERARAAVAEGLALSDGDPDALQRAELAWLGLRIEADGVLQARERRDAAAIAAGETSAMALSATGHSELARISLPGLAPWVRALGSRLDAEVPRLRRVSDSTSWEAAVAHADHTPDVFGQAYTRYRFAESLLDTGGGNRALAARVLQDCMDRARALGALPTMEDAQRLAVRARIRLDVAPEMTSPASTTPRVSARALGLSEREVDVLELLAAGMTDRDIGAHLFITEKTAGHHVSHILTKLTVSRRGEAAAVAHRLGVVGPVA